MKPSRLNAILLVLLLLILLPALLFTGYEFTRLGEAEEQISRVYAQQLDAVLFSVNQHAQDMTSSWMNDIQSALLDPSGGGAFTADYAARQQTQRAIRVTALYDSSGTLRASVAAGDGALEDSAADAPALLEVVGDSLREKRSTLNQLFRYRSAQYRKIESFPVPLGSGQEYLALMAVLSAENGRQTLAVMVIEPERFIRSVLGPKFEDVATEDIVLFCRDTRDQSVVISTGHVPADGSTDKQRKRLWLFRDYEAGIRLRGTTIEQLARDRFVQSGLLFAGIDLLLIAGVILVYRSFRKEVELAQLKSDFVSNVSHELKTPLALIRMFAETLEMNRVPTEEKRREYYAIIVQETERLTRLINNILTFSRIESGKKEYHMRPTDLNAVVEEVMNMYRFHLEHKGFHSETVLASDLPGVHADEEAVAEALINLIDNAMKYSDDEKRVTIRTRSVNGRPTVEVEDRGLGIAAEQQKKIFEKFYRVSEGLVHTAKGSGLGLSLVDAIMKAHHGSVEVESTLGEGSLFRLIFPDGDRASRINSNG